MKFHRRSVMPGRDNDGKLTQFGWNARVKSTVLSQCLEAVENFWNVDQWNEWTFDAAP
jgi:hypothetical protein